MNTSMRNRADEIDLPPSALALAAEVKEATLTDSLAARTDIAVSPVGPANAATWISRSRRVLVGALIGKATCMLVLLIPVWLWPEELAAGQRDTTSAGKAGPRVAMAPGSPCPTRPPPTRRRRRVLRV